MGKGRPSKRNDLLQRITQLYYQRGCIPPHSYIVAEGGWSRTLVTGSYALWLSVGVLMQPYGQGCGVWAPGPLFPFESWGLDWPDLEEREDIDTVPRIEAAIAKLKTPPSPDPGHVEKQAAGRPVIDTEDETILELWSSAFGKMESVSAFETPKKEIWTPIRNYKVHDLDLLDEAVQRYALELGIVVEVEVQDLMPNSRAEAPREVRIKMYKNWEEPDPAPAPEPVPAPPAPAPQFRKIYGDWVVYGSPDIVIAGTFVEVSLRNGGTKQFGVGGTGVAPSHNGVTMVYGYAPIVAECLECGGLHTRKGDVAKNRMSCRSCSPDEFRA